jgi:hypothetical protein
MPKKTSDDHATPLQRAAPVDWWERLRQAIAGATLTEVLGRLASGGPLPTKLQRWVDEQAPPVRAAIMACEQLDSRFAPAGYLRERKAGPPPIGATEEEIIERLRRVNPKAYKAQLEQREAAEDALAQRGVPLAVAKLATMTGVPTARPKTVDAMLAALKSVDASLLGRAYEAAGDDFNAIMPNYRRLIQQHDASLTRHLGAMHQAVADEAHARMARITIPDRVQMAEAAWDALAQSLGISVSTLRKREQELPKLRLDSPEGGEPASLQPRQQPEERRIRGRREL